MMYAQQLLLSLNIHLFAGNAYDYSEEEYPAVGERNMEGRYGELILLGSVVISYQCVDVMLLVKWVCAR